MKRSGAFTYASSEDMKRLDSAAIQGCGIDVLSLMENAGACVATLSRLLLNGSVAGKRVVCLAGKGNNGGDGLVAARHLSNWGASVQAILASPSQDFGGVASVQLRSATSMGIPLLDAETDLAGSDLILDALLGYSARGAPREPMAGMIRRANASKVPILAVDIPSGLDPDSGVPNDPTIRARATMTLALPKEGFLNPDSKSFVGDLYIGDVSIPLKAYAEAGLEGPSFANSNIIRVG
jgi:NAD(P)H-hydrate epimerase